MAEPHRIEFISAGPGDPDLLTVAGARRLASCGAVFAPLQFQESFSSLLRDKMVESPFQLHHAEAVAWVERHLRDTPVAFLIPGDFSVFNPFQSFSAYFSSRARVTPGVGSHAAAAAVLQRAFDLPQAAHTTVFTSPRAFTRPGSRVRLGDYARPGNTLVLFMNNRPLGELVAELTPGFGPGTPIAILERIACPDQVITRGTLDTIAAILGDRDPYGVEGEGAEPRLALTIVGEALQGGEPPEWWDRRVDTLWIPRGMR